MQVKRKRANDTSMLHVEILRKEKVRIDCEIALDEAKLAFAKA